MLFSKIRDIKIRNSFHRIEKVKKVKKFLFTNLLNKKSETSQTNQKTLLKSFSKSKNKMNSKLRVRMTNRCVINNRSRAVLRTHGISRILLRDLMQFGVLPGYSKAVW
jgi:ribosomal protein S14